MNRLLLLAGRLAIKYRPKVAGQDDNKRNTAVESATDGSNSSQKNTGLTQYDLVQTEMVKRRVIWLPHTHYKANNKAQLETKK